MGFRIRDLDTDDVSTYQAADQRYRAYLEPYPKSSNTHLWKYFYWDFFHDGWITQLGVSDDFATVTMSIVCPNIKRITGEGSRDFVYENIGFKCSFRNVVNLVLEADPPNDWSPGDPSATFISSEINTSPMLASLEPVDDDSLPFYSLLFEMMRSDRNVWLELVFNQVDVIADEPAAFALMESSPDFQVPTYERRRT